MTAEQALANAIDAAKSASMILIVPHDDELAQAALASAHAATADAWTNIHQKLKDNASTTNPKSPLSIQKAPRYTS